MRRAMLLLLALAALWPGISRFRDVTAEPPTGRAPAATVTPLKEWEIPERPMQLRSHPGGYLSYAVRPTGYLEAIGKRRLFRIVGDSLDPAGAIEALLDYDPVYRAPPLAVFSPSGTRLLVSTEQGTTVYDLKGGGSLSHLVRLSDRSVFGAAWSPDEKRIAYVTGERALWIVDAGGGAPRKVAQPVFKEFWRPQIPMSWSPDGEKILTHRAVVTIASGQVRELQGIPSDACDWFPDGKRVFCYGNEMVSADERNRIFVADAGPPEGRGAGRELPFRGRSPVISPDGSRLLFTANATSWGSGELALASVETGKVVLLGPGWDPHWWPEQKNAIIFFTRRYEKNPRRGISYREILVLASQR